MHKNKHVIVQQILDIQLVKPDYIDSLPKTVFKDNSDPGHLIETRSNGCDSSADRNLLPDIFFQLVKSNALPIIQIPSREIHQQIFHRLDSDTMELFYLCHRNV